MAFVFTFAGQTFVPQAAARHAVPRTLRSRSAVSRRVVMMAQKPEKVVLSPTPTLYVYDHCPFCIRVRFCLGMKNVKHNLVWFLNDDVERPTALIGKKMVPILEVGKPGDPGYHVMAESLDICKKVDSDPMYGPTGMFRPSTGRTDINGFLKENAGLFRRITYPRFVAAPLAEFSFQDARDAYIRNHPLPEPSDYQENFANSKEMIAELNTQLPKLDAMIFSENYCSEGGLSIDDIELFGRLRTWTIIKDLELPPKMKNYVENLASQCDMPLYTSMAL